MLSVVPPLSVYDLIMARFVSSLASAYIEEKSFCSAASPPAFCSVCERTVTGATMPNGLTGSLGSSFSSSTSNLSQFFLCGLGFSCCCEPDVGDAAVWATDDDEPLPAAIVSLDDRRDGQLNGSALASFNSIYTVSSSAYISGRYRSPRPVVHLRPCLALTLVERTR